MSEEPDAGLIGLSACSYHRCRATPARRVLFEDWNLKAAAGRGTQEKAGRVCEDGTGGTPASQE